jgi:hypothetical protein
MKTSLSNSVTNNTQISNSSTSIVAEIRLVLSNFGYDSHEKKSPIGPYIYCLSEVARKKEVSRNVATSRT